MLNISKVRSASKVKKIIFLCSLYLGILFSLAISAEDLLKIYKTAEINSSILTKEKLNTDKVSEKIKEFDAFFYPQINSNIEYSVTRNKPLRQHPETFNTFYTSFTISQCLFNKKKFNRFLMQKKIAQLQKIIYKEKQQRLILDITNMYFNILSKINSFYYIHSQKVLIKHAYENISNRSNIITNIKVNFHKKYSHLLHIEKNIYNDIKNILRQFNKITGKKYFLLSSLNSKVFKVNQTIRIRYFIKKAERNNLTFVKTCLQRDLARKNVKLIEDNYFPTLDISALLAISSVGIHKHYLNSTEADFRYQNNRNIQSKILFSLSLPIYQGGELDSHLRQARYDFFSISKMVRIEHLRLIDSLKSVLKNTISTVRYIKHYKKKIFSVKKKLDKEKKMVLFKENKISLLDREVNFYQARKNFFKYQYIYLTDQINVKYILGILNEKDLSALNFILKEPVATMLVSKMKKFQ